ncbi:MULTISPECIES: DUF6017 domain-containing protein [unclassified Butyrivibrio]|uniref:DUF6017 domain-containing protein n=1 Tax=unclassified Butyrivibrio TaxID=2639466 RepID=UPI00047BA1A5|nr:MULTISPECIES: DUF6017 domain-containing protein [unclassified Butyrivibrio]
MGEKIIFDYFYGQESEMHAFYRVPKLLFTNAHFKKLSSDAKILYGLMLDRMSLSQKNKWLDAENRAYIIYSQLEAMEMLNCKENKAINLFRELEAIGLLERRKQGQGKPSLIYLKDFVQEQILEKTSSEEKCSDMGKIKVKNLEKTMSGDGKKQGLDMGKTNANYNNINNNNLVIHTNHIYSMNQDMNDEYSAYAEIVRENLDIDSMSERYPQDVDIIEGIYDLVLETVLCRKPTIWISKNEYPTNLVKSKFLKLNHMHLEYVMGCMKDNTTKVRNIKNYLLSALFNAPTTMGSYYQAEYMYDRVRKAE